MPPWPGDPTTSRDGVKIPQARWYADHVDGPKSAYELAMERLRRKDAEDGDVRESVTDGQKAEIAEVRSRAEARSPS